MEALARDAGVCMGVAVGRVNNSFKWWREGRPLTRRRQAGTPVPLTLRAAIVPPLFSHRLDSSVLKNCLSLDWLCDTN